MNRPAHAARALPILTVVLFVLHVFYNWAVAYRLFHFAGGVKDLGNGWTRYGGVDFAWTTPLYVPGCLVFHLDHTLHGLRNPTPPYGLVGLLLLVAGSIISAWSLSSVLLATVFHDKQLLGRWFNRLLIAALGWVWVYVPIEWTWVYQWTVVY